MPVKCLLFEELVLGFTCPIHSTQCLTCPHKVFSLMASLPAPHVAGWKTVSTCRRVSNATFVCTVPRLACSSTTISLKAAAKQRNWQDYEDAVQSKDLGRALELLEDLSISDPGLDDEERVVSVDGVDGVPWNGGQDLLQILDACPGASNLSLVGKAYSWLQFRGILLNFGRYRARASEGVRVVTPAVLLASTGLEASKLSPKKWGLSGSSAVILFGGLALFSYCVDNKLEVRPMIALLMGLGLVDTLYLGGTGYGQVLSFWRPYRQRVLVHEAGHVVAAYLLGVPVAGVVLNALQALRMGIKGQAGAQFWDETLEEELKQDRITKSSIDRYCIVMFAGIAAEAMVYGEAEGGEGDENLFKAVISELQPPWKPSEMSNQARWAIIQAFGILKEQRNAHRAVVEALERGENLATVIRVLEAGVV